MGFSFWLKSNNGKSFSLESLQELIKDKGIADNPKLAKLFSLFDTDHDGKISTVNSKGEKELESIFSKFSGVAGDNQILEESEVSGYLKENNLENDLSVKDVFDFLGKFIKSNANEGAKQADNEAISEFIRELEAYIQNRASQHTMTEAEFNKIKKEAYNTVLTSTISTEKTEKDYDDLFTFAKEKLSQSGKTPTLEELTLYATELQMLNPDIKADKKVKKGTSIVLPAKSLDKTTLKLLENKGIKVEKDNCLFFQKLLELDDKKRATVLDVIKNSKFTTKEEVINEVYTKTRINLAGTGLTIKVGGVSSTLENFITKTLKLDLSSKEGLKIYERLCSLGKDASSVQATLNSFPKEFIDKLSKMNNITFDKFADKAEVFGIILRTDEEMREREKNSQEYRDLKARMFMAQYVADNYTSAVTISQNADRNLNFMQGTWWIRHSRPVAGTSTTDEQRRGNKKVEQIKQLMPDIDTMSNEEFASKMTTIMEAKRRAHSPGAVGAPVAATSTSFEIKDRSFKFDPKLAYTFMKQTQRAELAAGVAKRLEPQRKQHVERNPYVQQSDNTRVYNAQREIAGIEYTVEPFDKEELKQLTRYIKSIKTKKELFLFAKSLHYKVDVISNKVETMIPKENQAEIAELLEQKAKELGYAEPTRPNSISLDTFRNVFTKPIDKKVNYPKTNEKTLMETYEATKTKLLGTWDPVGDEIRTQELEGTFGGVIDIATMILITKGMGSMGAFVKVSNVGRNIGTATNFFKTANVASRWSKNAALINRLAKADKVLGGLWVNGAAGALHGFATMGAYGGLQGTVGMADNTVKNLLEGKEWSEGLGERFEQTILMGYENAKFGLFAGYSGVMAQALGKGTVALGSKGIDKLFKTNYSKTVLDKVSSVVTTEGISGSEFWTKMHAASKAEGLVGFGYETGFFTLYHKLEEAGVDFNNEESLLSAIEADLDEETKQSLGATYVSEAKNLAMFKMIGSLIQWVHIGKLSSTAAMELQANNNRALKNMRMRKVVENGKESYLVKFNENDKPIKVAPEQLMQLCEHKMFCADAEDRAQKDGSFKLPNNQTIEYDKAKKVYRTVIDAENTIESTSVEGLLAEINQTTFRNQINEQIFKDGQPATVKSLLKLVMTQNGEPIKINGVEIKPEEVLESSEALDNVKIERTKVNGKEVYTITLADGKTIQETSLDGLMSTCENLFQLELMKSVLEKSSTVSENSAEKTVASEETKPQNPATTSGSSEIQTFAEISNDFAQKHKSYDLYSDNDGNNVVMIVAVAGEKPNPRAGIPFTYEVYRFDKDGNQISEPLKGLSEKEAKKYQLENKQFVDNRASDNSGTLNSFVIPLPTKILNLFKYRGDRKKDSPVTDSKIINKQIEQTLRKEGFNQDELKQISSHLDWLDIKPENVQSVVEFCKWAKENSLAKFYIWDAYSSIFDKITQNSLENIKTILLLEKEGYDSLNIQSVCAKYLNEENAGLIKDILTLEGLRKIFNSNNPTDYFHSTRFYELLDEIFSKNDLKIEELEQLVKYGKENLNPNDSNQDAIAVIYRIAGYVKKIDLIKLYSEKLELPMDYVMNELMVYADKEIPADYKATENEIKFYKLRQLINIDNVEFREILENGFSKLTDIKQIRTIGFCCYSSVKSKEQAIILNRIIEEQPWMEKADIQTILKNTKTNEDCEAKLAMFDYIKELKKNNNYYLEIGYITRHLVNVLDNVNSMENVKAKTLLINKLMGLLKVISGDADLKTGSTLNRILSNTTTIDKAEAKIKFIDVYLKNLKNDDKSGYTLHYRGGELLNIIEIPEQVEIVDIALFNDKFENLRNNGIAYPSFITDVYKPELAKLRLEMMKRFINDEKLRNETRPYVLDILSRVIMTETPTEKHLEILKEYQRGEIDNVNVIPILLRKNNSIDIKQYKKLQHKMGRKNVDKLSENDLIIACKMTDVYKVTNLNEITAAGKKQFIRALVECNSGMFEISEEMKKMFPLIPTNVDQYCGLMRATVKSLGIETNPLTPEQRITMFNHSMKDLSKSLADLSDKEFAGLHITQEFSREDFIAVVREKTKDLSQLEKQKVYDYFGFELHHKKAKEQRKEYTITGYPVNLNNGKKLAEITDPQTKAVVESLRLDVIRFSEHNPIKCENPKVEQFLNEVVSAMPEVRSMIGRAQHGNNGTKGAHDFDVMQHSLKVMQKITQDHKFKELNESDQRIMLLASLLHDITKAEGVSDHTHAAEGGFDTYYICKKLNLSEDEELKLFNLTRLHEWLNFVNKSESEEQLTKRLQSVAFDMQNGNLFDMALIFTHADLKAVKADDTFHDTRVGDTRAVFDNENNRVFGTAKQSTGVKKSHGETADIYAERIREYIHELQKTRPLTPTTKVPTMSEIKSRLKVNPDGSTQFKGVWVDKDGLVVIKVNDVEDWEALGFPKGTTTKGIKANVKNHGEERHEVETGNFKLMMHGLDYPNQLVKFEKFTLPDTKELLSITYAERPETKSRFFRPQGVGLDFDAEHVHGGGETDAGSGCGKTVDDFKKDYIFGGEREGDRVFTANIVKKDQNMTDEEYIEFYDKNKGKSWSEYEDQELANHLIKAYAEGIKSNVRGAKRAYTEYYGSKVKRVNSTWVYSVDYNEKINNPLEFLHRTELTEGEQNARKIGYEDIKPVAERTSFLREFSNEHDVPMLIFGD